MALLGPSGSGKSTLIRILSGYQTTSQGRIFWKDALQDAGKQLMPGFAGMAYVSQDAHLAPFVRIEEQFRQRLNRVPINEARRRIDRIVGRFGIEALMSAKPEELSMGQRQRCALGLAFSVAPSLIALDEPFTHQDAWQRQLLLEACRLEAAACKATILLATHQLEEAQYLCKHCLYLLDGQVAYRGKWEGLRNLPIPEAQALFGWLSQDAGDLVRYKVCKDGADTVALAVRACRPKGDGYLLIGTMAKGQPAFALSDVPAKKGEVVQVGSY